MNDRFGLIRCGSPLGFVNRSPFLPSLRFAALGFGVELLCSSFQTGTEDVNAGQPYPAYFERKILLCATAWIKERNP